MWLGKPYEVADRPRDDPAAAVKVSIAAIASTKHLRDVPSDAWLLSDDEDGGRGSHGTSLHFFDAYFFASASQTIGGA